MSSWTETDFWETLQHEDKKEERREMAADTWYVTWGALNAWWIVLGALTYNWYPQMIATNTWWKTQCPITAYTGS
jgi:hypothetical protein